MKTKIFILTLILLTTASQGSLYSSSPDKKKEHQFPSFYLKGAAIDGKAEEWPANQFHFNKDADVTYATGNDSTIFYTCIKIHSQEQQMKFFKGGFEIWFNVVGKKKKTTSLRFPLPNSFPQQTRYSSMTTNGKPDLKKIRLMILLQLNQVELSGFRDEFNGLQNNKKNKAGIVAVVDWDSTGNLVYECKIPFVVFKEKVDESVPLMIGMILKGIEKSLEKPGERPGEKDDRDLEQIGNNRTPGGGYQAGREERNRSGYSRNWDEQKMQEDNVVWYATGIAR
ncbi:MAG: hypothetical protein WCL00_10825 [Bacteroidota bacterium]